MKPSISASVGLNSTNRKPDVETVQGLLNRVPIEEGGPTPKLAVDGLCYGKTLAAISRFQKVGCGFQWPDQRIDPDRRTWNELVRYAEDTPSGRKTIRCYPTGGETAGFTQAGFIQASFAASSPVTPASLVADATIQLPLAIGWVSTAQVRLNAVRKSIARFKVYSTAELDLALPFKTHFRINIAAQTDVVARSRLDRVGKTYSRIMQALGSLGTRMVGNPSEPAKAVAPLGGFDDSGSVVTIGADFVGPGSTPNLKSAVLIHECAHFVDADCGHVASERPAPDGSAITDDNGKLTNPAGKNYAQMDFDLAIRNAYSFAQCAAHCGLGKDQRPL